MGRVVDVSSRAAARVSRHAQGLSRLEERNGSSLRKGYSRLDVESDVCYRWVSRGKKRRASRSRPCCGPCRPCTTRRGRGQLSKDDAGERATERERDATHLRCSLMPSGRMGSPDLSLTTYRNGISTPSCGPNEMVGWSIKLIVDSVLPPETHRDVTPRACGGRQEARQPESGRGREAREERRDARCRSSSGRGRGAARGSRERAADRCGLQRTGRGSARVEGQGDEGGRSSPRGGSSPRMPPNLRVQRVRRCAEQSEDSERGRTGTTSSLRRPLGRFLRERAGRGGRPCRAGCPRPS